MIRIADEDDRTCISCCSDTVDSNRKLLRIEFLKRDMYGSQVYLCEKCAYELLNKLESYLKEIR